MLDGRRLELGDALHAVHRDRRATAGSHAHEQHALAHGAILHDLRLHLDLLLGRACDACAQRWHVEDERHAPVPAHRGTGEVRQAAQALGERLHHDLLGVEQRVDHEPEAALVGAQHHEPGAHVGRRLGVLAAQAAAQEQHRQHLPAQPEHRQPADVLDACEHVAVGPGPHDFFEVRLRDGVALTAVLHRERRHDGERERDRDVHARALARRGVEFDAATHGAHRGFDHVHAHAAPRDAGDACGRGEAGAEDEAEPVAVGERLRLLGRHEPAFQRAFADAVHREPGAVVTQLQMHAAALLPGAQFEPALAGLARRGACRRVLDAVIHGVAHQVRERVLECVDHGLVELGGAALEFEVHLLAARRGGLARDARQPRPQRAHRLHARAHDLFLQP